MNGLDVRFRTGVGVGDTTHPMVEQSVSFVPTHFNFNFKFDQIPVCVVSIGVCDARITTIKPFSFTRMCVHSVPDGAVRIAVCDTAVVTVESVHFFWVKGSDWCYRHIHTHTHTHARTPSFAMDASL